MLSEQEKRILIKSIKSDITLAENEKNKKIQQIMMGNFVEKKKCVESNCLKTCEHYNKKCYKFHFTCCNIYDPCIRCHKERIEFDNENILCDINTINIDKITCSECDFEQIISEFCSNCSIKFANSHCNICKIYTEKNITHCEYCKICRVGNKDDLFHCFNCNGCFFSKDKEKHKCTINLQEETCSVCNESVFNSRYDIHISTCNQPIHINCLEKSLEHNQYKCSRCKKSIIDMSQHWDLIRINIANTPLPTNMFPINLNDIVDSPYGKFKVLEKVLVNNIILCKGIFVDWKLKNNNYTKGTFDEKLLNKKIIKEIYCNDCCKKSTGNFHFYGIECIFCKSFNTQE